MEVPEALRHCQESLPAREVRSQRDAGELLLDVGAAWQDCRATLAAVWEYLDKVRDGAPTAIRPN